MSNTTDGVAPPRDDLRDAIFWIALGLVTLAGSITMDRLESQHIDPVTAPGLLPGLLGICLILLGTILGVRSWRRGALSQAPQPADALSRERNLRVAITLALCGGYSVLLVGHGIPFWLASTVYIAGSILVFRRLNRDPGERRLDVRAWIKALSIGAITSVVTWLVFEKLFLVRLP